MNDGRSRRFHGESGAALILAIAFLVAVAGIGTAVIASVSTGLSDRTVLDQARNREYAADGGIENAIAQVRGNMQGGGALTPCAGLTTPPVLDGVQIAVACTYVPTPALSGLVQRNAIFTAQCATVSPPECPNTNVIERAQVNFESQSPLSASTIAITHTYIQAWSVNS